MGFASKLLTVIFGITFQFSCILGGMVGCKLAHIEAHQFDREELSFLAQENPELPRIACQLEVSFCDSVFGFHFEFPTSILLQGVF